MRQCGITDEQLLAFADGEDEVLEEHIAGCDECQRFLADLWSGELKRDLAEPVMRTLRFERFLSDVARIGLGVAARMGRAAVVYSIGEDPSEGGIEPSPAGG